MKSVSLRVVFTGCLLAGVTALAAQQQSAASTQASSNASGQAQAAVALVLKQYTINQDVMVANTKKPLPKDGTWGVRQAQGAERVAECEVAGAMCREVLYRFGQPEMVCGWTVLFLPNGGVAKVVNLNDVGAMYMLRSFDQNDPELPKKIKGNFPDPPPIARVAHMRGNVELRAVVDAAGKIHSLSVVDTTNPMFNNTAIDAVKSWQMETFTLNGRPLPYVERLVIRFSNL